MVVTTREVEGVVVKNKLWNSEVVNDKGDRCNRELNGSNYEVVTHPSKWNYHQAY